MHDKRFSSGSVASASKSSTAESANDSSEHGSAADPVHLLGDSSAYSSQLSTRSTVMHASMNGNSLGSIEAERASRRLLEPMPLEVREEDSLMINSVQDSGVSKVSATSQEAVDGVLDGSSGYPIQDIEVHEMIQEEEDASRWSSMASGAFLEARLSPQTAAHPGEAVEAKLEDL